MQRARITLLTFALFVAGCASPDEVEAPVVPERPPTVEAEFAAVGYPGSMGKCTPDICATVEYVTDVLWVPLDRRLVGLEVKLAPNRGGPELHWRLLCTLPEGNACQGPLAEGWEEDWASALEFSLSNLSLPAGSFVRLGLADNTSVLDPEWYVEANTQGARQVDIWGKATFEVVATPVEEVRIPVYFEGHTGPCSFAPGDCTHSPGGTRQVFDPAAGPLVALDLVATWEPQSPLDDEVRISIRCTKAEGAPEGRCPEEGVFVFEGPSPLEVRTDTFWLAGSPLRVAIDSAAGFGSRTPVTIEGSVLELRPLTAS